MAMTNSAECGIRTRYVKLNIATSDGSCERVAALPDFIQGWQFSNTWTTETTMTSALLSSIYGKRERTFKILAVTGFY